MKIKLTALAAGMAFGFLLAWARLSDPRVIHEMLLLRKPDVYPLMGSAIAVAAAGCRLLRMAGAKAVFTGEPICWSNVRPEPRHIGGSVLFGIGWSVAGTCPGPAAAMIGEGRFVGAAVGTGILLGVVLHEWLPSRVSRFPFRWHQ